MHAPPCRNRAVVGIQFLDESHAGLNLRWVSPVSQFRFPKVASRAPAAGAGAGGAHRNGSLVLDEDLYHPVTPPPKEHHKGNQDGWFAQHALQSLLL